MNTTTKPPTRASSTARPSASPDATDWLFAKLLTMFGRQWADMWTGIDPAIVKADWRHALTGIDTEAIRLAVESMNRDGRDYPPNQAQFVALARQFVRRGAHRLAITDGRRDPPPGGFESIRSILKRQ
jgi:hypothetical protein